jgi:hypothetical protein
VSGSVQFVVKGSEMLRPKIWFAERGVPTPALMVRLCSVFVVGSEDPRQEYAEG